MQESPYNPWYLEILEISDNINVKTITCPLYSGPLSHRQSQNRCPSLILMSTDMKILWRKSLANTGEHSRNLPSSTLPNNTKK